MRRTRLTILSFIACVAASSAFAQHDVDELAKKTQNPLGDVISVPFQLNFNPSSGPFNRNQFVLNVQPVVPIAINPDWNLIVRPIIPLLSQPAGPLERNYGFGDIQLQTYLTPKHAGDFVWGIGSIVQFPTRTDPSLGNGMWGVGPGAIIVKFSGPWVYGALVNHVWSIGDPSPTRFEYSITTMQPFVNYNFGGGVALGVSSTMTYNWDAISDQQWTVPLGVTLTKTFVVDSQPMSIGAGVFYNIVRPDNVGEWQFRLQFSLIFPEGK